MKKILKRKWKECKKVKKGIHQEMLENFRKCSKMLENSVKHQKILENLENAGNYQKILYNAEKTLETVRN